MVAIIIPYNKISFFEEAMRSLANQTDKRFKVYIGDDASPENPLRIVANFQEKIDLVYHRFETNLGGTSLVQQWDRCIALSGNEEWLMILGDDDCIGPNCIADFYENHPEIDTNKCNVVRFATIEIDENSNPISNLYKHPKFEKATDSFYRKIRNKTRSSLSEYIFKRKAYDEYGFRDFPLAWGSDDLAWLDFTDFGNIYSISESVVYFRISNENISRKDFQVLTKKRAHILFFGIIVKQFLKKFDKEKRLPLLLYYEQMIYKSDGASISFWMDMCKLLLHEFEFIQFIKFTRRVLIYHSK
jgi:glycosyltransferase involved in cell wall biosynthesis